MTQCNYIYIYIYIYTHTITSVCVCVCVYTHTYMNDSKELSTCIVREDCFGALKWSHHVRPKRRCPPISLHSTTTQKARLYLHTQRCESHGATARSGPSPPHHRGFTITLRHTTLGRTSLDE